MAQRAEPVVWEVFFGVGAWGCMLLVARGVWNVWNEGKSETRAVQRKSRTKWE